VILGYLGEPLGTPWKHIGNKGENKKFLSTPHPPPK